MRHMQRRGRRIAMTDPELDRFFAEERTCRLATVRPERGPHVTPLWFVWHDQAIWLNSLVGSQRWTDLQHDPRVAVLVDAGVDYQELRGAELIGRVEFVGEAPRIGNPLSELETPERLFAEKYRGTSTPVYDGKHGWLRLRPERVVSWDFRKM